MSRGRSSVSQMSNRSSPSNHFSSCSMSATTKLTAPDRRSSHSSPSPTWRTCSASRTSLFRQRYVSGILTMIAESDGGKFSVPQSALHSLARSITASIARCPHSESKKTLSPHGFQDARTTRQIPPFGATLNAGRGRLLALDLARGPASADGHTTGSTVIIHGIMVGSGTGETPSWRSILTHWARW